MRLLATYHIEGTVKVLTGLHIGSGDQGLRIGGIDMPVIKTIDNKPYIPGSSLKGKVRSELEWKNGRVKAMADDIINKKYDGKAFNDLDKKEQIKKLSDVRACNCGECPICLIFGHTNTEKKRFTRAIFRDLYLKDTNIKTEAKSENTISRITSEATPRQIERVPVDTEFDLKIVVKTYENSDLNLLKLLFEGLMAVEESFLGGGGSRGNGQVEFTNISIYKRTSEDFERRKIGILESKPSDIILNFEAIKSSL